MVASTNPAPAEPGITRAPSGGIRRVPSGGFKRVNSSGSVTFDRTASNGGIARVPSYTRSASGGSAKGFISRVASNATKASTGGGVAPGGSSAWAKLRAVAAVTQTRVASDAFSSVPSGFQRVPSANAPGSLGYVVPLTQAATLTEEQSLRQSRDDIRKWKEAQWMQVQEKIVNLEQRMTRLSVMDNRLSGATSIDEDGGYNWTDVLPGAVPEKVETETQKFIVAKNAAQTVRRIVTGDLDLPPSPMVIDEEEENAEVVYEAEDDLSHFAKLEVVLPVQDANSKPSTANTQVHSAEINEFGWKVKTEGGSKRGSEASSPTEPFDAGKTIGGNGDEEDKKEEEDGLHFEPLPHKPEIKLETIDDCCERSCTLLCGGFSRTNLQRNICFAIYSSKYAQAVFHLLWMANVIFIAYSPEMNRLVFNRWRTMGMPELIALGFNIVCVLILSIEVVSGIIALGFIRSPKAFLNVTVFNRIDFLVLLMCAVEGIGAVLTPIGGMEMPTLRPFRLLRVFKNINTLKILRGFDTLMDTLDQCSGQLLTIALICLFYFAIFSVFGMAMYQKSFRRTCVVLDHLVPSCASDFSTGWYNTCANKDFMRQSWVSEDGGKLFVASSGYPSDMACKYWDVNDPKKGLEESSFEEKYPKDAQGRYHTCQLQEFRTNGATAVTTMCEDLTNPMNGFMHFDNAWGALFVVAQVAIPDAQYEVLTRALDSEPVAWVLTAFFYGFLISGFCTFMELGLFLAVIAKTYDLVEKEHTMKHGTLLRIESHAPAQVMRVRQLLEARAFCFVLYMVIIMQTAMLAVEGYAMEGTRQLLMTVVGDADVEFYVHLSCNIFFGIECFLHFWASSFSVRRLGRHADYLFHFVLLVTSVLGFILSYDPLWPQPVKDVFSTKAVGTVLKASVSLRLYRLMAVLPTLDHILQDAIRSLRSVFNIAIFLFLCTFCVAVTGIYLIGDKMKGRSNFSNLWSAALTSFQIFTRDSWTGIMYDAMDAGESRFWSIINAIFVIFWLFFSSFVVGNLFIATIVTHIKVSDAINDIEKDGYKVWISRQVHRAYNIFLMLKHKSQNQLQNLHQTMSTMQLVKPNSPNFFERQARSPMFSSRLITAHGSPDFVEEEDSLMSYFPDLKKIPVEKRTEFLSTTINVVEDMFSNSQSAHEKKKKKHAAANLTIEYDEPVLCGFSKQFLVRTMCIHIDQNPAFDALIYFVVILSCLIIAIAPQYPDVPGTTPVLGLTYEVGTILNVVFTIIFLAEFIVRTMSRGFFNTRRAYLSLSWNRLDFGILIFALIDLLGIIPSASAGKVLRSARVLSPLRAIKKNEGMVILVNAFIGTLQPIGYVVLYTLFTYAVFALLGMSFFGGRFYSCSTPGAEYPGGKSLCSGSHALEASSTAYMVPRSWDNPPFHFDDLSTSLLTIYRLGTLKYIQVMNAAMDVTYVDQSPKHFFSAEFAIFFIVFIILGSFFVINIVVAFTVDGINVKQGRTDADLRFNEVMAFVLQIMSNDNRIPPASNVICTMLRKVLDSPYFGVFSAMCIAANAVFMLTDHADASTEFQAMLDTQNDIFFAELVSEVVLRFIADGPRHFFTRWWNLFDAVVAFGLGMTYAGGFVEFGQFAKGFRLVRLIRLILFVRPVRIIFDTLLISMPQLINVAGVLFLIMFTSASLGVALYSETKFQAKLGPAANFRTFPEALKVIYQIFTGEEWQDLMAECSIQPPFCTMTFEGFSFGDCGYVSVTPMFFIVLKVLCELMILNLLVGMILDNLNVIMNSVDHVETDDWRNGASFNQVNNAAVDFKRFSSNSNKISLTCIRPLLHTMRQPLGFRNTKGELIMGTHVSPPHAHAHLS